jgi:hypothetical protein
MSLDVWSTTKDSQHILLPKLPSPADHTVLECLIGTYSGCRENGVCVFDPRFVVGLRRMDTDRSMAIPCDPPHEYKYRHI